MYMMNSHSASRRENSKLRSALRVPRDGHRPFIIIVYCIDGYLISLYIGLDIARGTIRLYICVALTRALSLCRTMANDALPTRRAAHSASSREKQNSKLRHACEFWRMGIVHQPLALRTAASRSTRKHLVRWTYAWSRERSTRDDLQTHLLKSFSFV